MIKGVLFQEELCKDPFWMLVACVLVNRTKWKQAEPVFEKLRAKYVTSENLAKEKPANLFDVVKILGFGNSRAISLPRMAQDYIRIDPIYSDEIPRLHGCGKYAADSWAIFVEGRRDVEPTDVELKGWLEKHE